MNQSRTVLALALLLVGGAGGASGQVVALDPADGRWAFRGEAEVTREGGEEVLSLRSGSALRRDVRFSEGTIQFELLPTDRRTFLGLVFRVESGDVMEDVYFRLHKSLLPDAIQYSPDYGGHGQWQLYHGADATAAARYVPGEWQRVRIEVSGSAAAVFVGDAREPQLVVDRLRSGAREGGIGFWGNYPGASGDDPPTALLRNVIVRHGEVSYGFPTLEPEVSAPDVIRRWGVSTAFHREGERVLELPAGVIAGEWRTLAAEPSGLLPLERAVRRPADGVPAVLAGLRIRTDRARVVRLDLGFSDDLSAFLDGRLLYSGRNGFSPNFPRRQGLITLDQASLYLPLEAGESRLVLAVSEIYGGWGLMGRIEDRDGLDIAPLERMP